MPHGIPRQHRKEAFANPRGDAVTVHVGNLLYLAREECSDRQSAWEPCFLLRGAAMSRSFVAACAICIGVGVTSLPVAAQVQEDSLLHYAREQGIAAANRSVSWPFGILGAVAGFPIGAAIGDLPNTRVGEEAGYRKRRVAFGATVLLGGSIVAREAYVRLEDQGFASSAEFTAARNAYVSRLRRRRTQALLAGAGVGAAVGFAVYAFVPKGT